MLPIGTCLAILAANFFDTWKHVLKLRKTRSQRVRERDEGFCQVPGCNHRAAHSHHVEFRARRGSDDLENQVASASSITCASSTAATSLVVGKAPEALTWLWKGELFTGMPRE